MSVAVVCRTDRTPLPDILKRVRAFLVAIALAALLFNAITLPILESNHRSDYIGLQLTLLALIGIWWAVRHAAKRARWFDLVIDFLLLAALTAASQSPDATAGVYYPALLLRSMYESRSLLAIIRPFVFGGALAAGTLFAVTIMGTASDMTRLLLVAAPVLITGAIAGALTQLILSHRIALQQESDLLALSTAIASEHRPGELARTIANSMQALAARSCGEPSRAFVALYDAGQFRVYDPDGLAANLDPATPIKSAETARHFGENVARSLLSEGSLISEVPGQHCTVAPFGIGKSNRGAIALCTPRSPNRILRNGLGLAAENAGLAIEGADLNASFQASEQRRAALLSEVVTASEDQRANLAGDLHDGPIQSLTALAFELDFSDDLLKSGEIEVGRRALRAMKQQLFGEINRLRQTMAELLPPVLSERGIERALRDYTRQQAAANEGIRFTFNSTIKVRPPEVAERMLYRVAQEALANAIRHARSTQIDISVTGGEDRILIAISDDGHGFDVNHISDLISRDRFGIASMQHIMEMIGGTLKITSSATAGTTVILSAPIEPSEVRSVSDGIPAVQ